MEAMYPYFLIIHLVCAVIFIGYIFSDVILLSPIKKILGDEIADKVFGVIQSRGTKIMPIMLLLIIISGGGMISRWVNSDIGFFETNLQKILIAKVAIAMIIVVMVITSLSFKFLIKKPNPLAKIIHPIALVLGFIIIILAKLAFYVS